METNISLGKNKKTNLLFLKKANTTMSLVLAIFYFGIIHNFEKYVFLFVLFLYGFQ